jgi:hypothetical protein
MRIFITYYRADSSVEVGRIYERLRSHFGPGNVFLDEASLRYGVSYPDELRKRLDESDVLIVVIGPKWVDLVTKPSSARNWVRYEIGTALANDTAVIPVLVGGATAPRPETVPDDIRDALRKQAVPLEPRRMTTDLRLLTDAIRANAPHAFRRRFIAPAILPAVLVLLWIGISGPWAVAQVAQSQHITPEVINPCSFAEPPERSLSKIGSVQVDPHTNNFNECDLILDPATGRHGVEVQFSLEYPGTLGDPASVTRYGSVTVKTYDASDCDQVLSQTNHYELDISAKYRDGSTGGNLCSIVDKATIADRNFLNEGGKLQVRSRWADPTSLIHVDACGLLDPSTLTHFGLATAGRQGLWNWRCNWPSTAKSDANINIRFDQGQPGSVRLEPFGRFSGYVEPRGDDEDADDCVAVIEYRNLPDAAVDDPVYEMVRVAVYGTGSLEAVCDMARRLGQDVASNL